MNYNDQHGLYREEPVIALVHIPPSQNKATISKNRYHHSTRPQTRTPIKWTVETLVWEERMQCLCSTHVRPQVEVVVRILPRLLPRELHTEPTDTRTSQVPARTNKRIRTQTFQSPPFEIGRKKDGIFSERILSSAASESPGNRTILHGGPRGGLTFSPESASATARAWSHRVVERRRRRSSRTPPTTTSAFSTAPRTAPPPPAPDRTARSR